MADQTEGAPDRASRRAARATEETVTRDAVSVPDAAAEVTPAAEVLAAELSERTHPMGVANMAFLVERLFADCAPGQFVRELTKNGVQAIDRLPQVAGKLIWTIERHYYQTKRVAKLAVVDTGVGMTGDEMVRYINSLAYSSYTQSTTANFGVGAKISAAPLNREGMVYCSWKDGVGCMVNLWKNPTTGVYGLRQMKRPDGTYGFWTVAPEFLKPKEIDKHGTMVVLLGNAENEDTTRAPAGVNTPSRWILRYLNGRFFRFPDGVDVRVHEGWDLPESDTKRNTTRRILGLEAWLNEGTEDKGTVDLTSARVHWWILKADVNRTSGHYPTPGLVAALWQDELYDMVTSGRAGFARLQAFGVIFESDRVAIIVEPVHTGGELTSNTARTTLLLNGEPLPWAEWASEFRQQLPAQLKALMEEAGSRSADADVRQAIKERLKSVRDLFTFSRYRRATHGAVKADPSSRIDPDEPPPVVVTVVRPEPEPRERGVRRSAAPRAGDLYAALVAAEAERAVEVEPVIVREMPSVHWISRHDNSRKDDQLEDRAALYSPENNVLLINADFRVFTDMERRWLEQFPDAPGAEHIVRTATREWFEQQLLEAVMSAKSLLGSPQWAEEDVKELWSERALTAVVLPRYHIDEKIKRTIGSKLAAYREPIRRDEPAITFVDTKRS